MRKSGARSVAARFRAGASARGNGRSVVLICLTALVTSVATAGAASLITGKDVADGSLTGSDIKKNSVPLDRLAGDGAAAVKRAKSGPVNYAGDDDHGDRGRGSRGGPHWGIIARNTIGSSVGDLRNGPFVSPPGAGDSPPFGDGSVGLQTKDGTEKVAYGNEVDFFGDKVADLDEVGFHVFQTGENIGSGGPTNMPNISFEIDPTGFNDTTAPNYTTLTWNPPPVAPNEINRWSDYKDATASGLWGVTGGFYNGNPMTIGALCGLNGPRCSFAAVKAVLGPNAQILSAAVAKGRDNPWVGAVDGLRINNEVFDFELTGVRSRRAW
jgi:hypothetical protein